MKVNKILISLLLVFVLSLQLIGCGKEEAAETIIETTESVTTEETVEPIEEPIVKEDDSLTSEAEEITESEVTITEELDTKLYVVKEANLLRLDNEDAKLMTPVEIGAYLTVTGITSNNWYRVVWGDSVGYLPADVLSTENPIQEATQEEKDALDDYVEQQQNNMTPEEQKEWEEIQEILDGMGLQDQGEGEGIEYVPAEEGLRYSGEWDYEEW